MKTSVFVGVSVDGFLARSNGAFDFLSSSGAEKDNGYEEFFATVDALVIGRNTYDVVLTLPTWPYGTKPVVVLSSRPLTPPPSGSSVERMSCTPREVLNNLESRGLNHVYVDGGMTIQRFLRAGLIQRLVITRVPVLIGSGVPLFGPVETDVPLRHVATRYLSGGAVQSEYAIEPTSTASAQSRTSVAAT